MGLRPVKMAKVRLIGLKSNLERTIGALESYGGIEIRKVHAKGLDNIRAFAGHDETIAKMLRAEAMLSRMQPTQAKARMGEKETSEFLKSKEFREILERIEKTASEIEGAEGEIANLQDMKARLRKFSNFGIDFGKLASSSVEIVAGIVPAGKGEAARKAIEAIPDCSFAQKPASKNTTMFIVALAKGRDQQLENVLKTGFERVTIPQIGSTPQKAIKSTECAIAELEARKAALEKELGKISAQFYPKVAACHELLGIQAGKSNAASAFAGSLHSFIVEGYLPEGKFARFSQEMRDEFGERIEIIKISAQELERRHEEAPTLLEHPKILGPFEFMTKFVSIPKSNEIDPTMIFLLFFPIFYGMMVGDVIYGLVSFILARWIMSKVTPDNILKPISLVWMWSAIPTIIFGFIFDEFLGVSHTEIVARFTGAEHVVLYHGLERIHNIELLLGITIIVGVITIASGFGLGLVNALSHGNRKHAIAKGAWLGLTLFGSAAVGTMAYSVFPAQFLTPFTAVAALCVAVIIWAEGFMGIIEIPSVMGNILSFARIIAVGLVGAIIATILNDMAFPSLDKGALLILLIPLYIAGHLMNAGLAMFESLIQGARLNYVEFYSKFFEGGGREFSPFKFERKYTKSDT